MTTASTAIRPGAPALGRVAAGLTGASAAVHALQVTTSSLAALAMALMALACLPCAWHLWRSPTPSVWGLTALLDVTMLDLHVQWTAATSGHAHHGGSAGGLPSMGIALVAASLAVSAVALARRFRGAVSAGRR